jgi:asparagine synthase (glutamine-hydrolysing)
MAPLLREWLMESDKVPFINREELLKSFDLIVSGKVPFTWQVWRWVNFVRWYSYTFV